MLAAHFGVEEQLGALGPTMIGDRERLLVLLGAPGSAERRRLRAGELLRVQAVRGPRPGAKEPESVVAVGVRASSGADDGVSPVTPRPGSSELRCLSAQRAQVARRRDLCA